jgi:hypothetical protein
MQLRPNLRYLGPISDLVALDPYSSVWKPREMSWDARQSGGKSHKSCHRIWLLSYRLQQGTFGAIAILQDDSAIPAGVSSRNCAIGGQFWLLIAPLAASSGC